MIPLASRTRLTLVSLGALGAASVAFGAGYEKAQTWSAKSSAEAGAVVGSTAGAEALYFNPAGLARASRRGEISVNFSPTLSQFSGRNSYAPASVGTVSGSTTLSPVLSVLAAYRPTPKLGLGVGYYVSGGSRAKFENLDYSTLDADFDTVHPTAEADLSIKELAVGAGYELARGFRVGLSWRMVKVGGKFSTVRYTGTALAQIDLDNIDATRLNAWKLGAQYEEPAHRWGLGFALRTSVAFTATADGSGHFETADGSNPGSSSTSLGTGAVEIENTFPLQVSLGGWTRATELLRLFWQYDFTNYAKDRTLGVHGTVGATPLTDIAQDWKNMHVFRLGGEYTRFFFPVRMGYAYTSAVTSTDAARSTFSSPGPGHSLTVGSGFILNGNIDVDGALEYSFASGTGRNAAESLTTDSEFKSHAYAAHFSARYRF